MVELTLLALAASADAVSDALVEAHGALSVTVEDADAGSAEERALFGEPGLASDPTAWPRARIAALFPAAAAAEAAATAIASLAGDTVRIEAIRPVADRDWVRLTQAQFTPTEI